MERDELSIQGLQAEATKQGLTVDRIITLLEKRIKRDQAYLLRRRRRGTHTPTDELLRDDLPMLAMVIDILQGPAMPVTTTPPGSTTVRIVNGAHPFAAIYQPPPIDQPVHIEPGKHDREEKDHE